jgi:hypothetical protein
VPGIDGEHEYNVGVGDGAAGEPGTAQDAGGGGQALSDDATPSEATPGEDGEAEGPVLLGPGADKMAGTGAATPSRALRSPLGRSTGDEVWVYVWKHTPQADDGTGAMVNWDWDLDPTVAPPADPDRPDTCPGLKDVLTHSVYEGYTVYLMADIMIPGGIGNRGDTSGGCDLAEGIKDITIDGVWPSKGIGDYDGDGVPDDLDDDLDGDGIPNATYGPDGEILSLDMEVAGAKYLYQDPDFHGVGSSGYNNGVQNTDGRFWSIRVTHPFDRITLRNMNTIGQAAEGLVWVSPDGTGAAFDITSSDDDDDDDGPAGSGTGGGGAVGTGPTGGFTPAQWAACENALCYRNLCFTGPQMVYNVNGRAIFENVNITMAGPDKGSAGDTHGGFGAKQEVAQLCRAEFEGFFNVHFDTCDTTKKFHAFSFTPTMDTYIGDANATTGAATGVDELDGSEPAVPAVPVEPLAAAGKAPALVSGAAAQEDAAKEPATGDGISASGQPGDGASDGLAGADGAAAGSTTGGSAAGSPAAMGVTVGSPAERGVTVVHHSDSPTGLGDAVSAAGSGDAGADAVSAALLGLGIAGPGGSGTGTGAVGITPLGKEDPGGTSGGSPSTGDVPVTANGAFPTGDYFGDGGSYGMGGNYVMIFRENSRVTVVAQHTSLTYMDTNATSHGNDEVDWSNLDMILEGGAHFRFIGYAGFTDNAFDAEVGEFYMGEDAQMHVHIMGTPTADEYPGFPLVGTALIRKGALFIYQNDVGIYPKDTSGLPADQQEVWALIGDSKEGYNKGFWNILGGEVDFIQTGDISDMPDVPRALVRQLGFDVLQGGKFTIRQTKGRFALAYPCIELGGRLSANGGMDALHVYDPGSTFECVLRNSHPDSEGIRSYGGIAQNYDTTFSVQIREYAGETNQRACRSVFRMMNADAVMTIEQPRSFVLASAKGRLIEYGVTGYFGLIANQVNYWTRLPKVPEPPEFPDRPNVHWENAPDDTQAVKFYGNLAQGTDDGAGLYIMSAHYTGDIPVGHPDHPDGNGDFLYRFNTIRAISAGVLDLAVAPYSGELGEAMTGTSTPDSSIHIFKGVVDDTTDYNSDDYRLISDRYTGAFSVVTPDIGQGQSYTVMASRNFLFRQLDLVTQGKAKPCVVYVDGQLPDDLRSLPEYANMPPGLPAIAYSPDAPGRGSNPKEPVKTLRRAFEILKETGGHILYVCGTVDIDRPITLKGYPSDVACSYPNRESFVYYDGTAGELEGVLAHVLAEDPDKIIRLPRVWPVGTEDGAPLADVNGNKLVKPVEIRRFAKPTSGDASLGAGYHERFDVPDFQGVLFHVTASGSLYLENITIDGHHEERQGEVHSVTFYQDLGNGPEPVDTLRLDAEDTQVIGRMPAALAPLILVDQVAGDTPDMQMGEPGDLNLLGGVTLRDNCNEYDPAQASQGSQGRQGGAICCAGAARISNENGNGRNMIQGNTAKEGGGIYVAGSPAGAGSSATPPCSIYMDGARVLQNTAQSGGGVYLDKNSAGAMADTWLELNKATQGDGGGIYSGGNLSLGIGSKIVKNEATNGGGVFLATDSEATLTRAVVEGNESDRGAGAYLQAGAKMDVKDTTVFQGNIAQKSGGGIHNRGAVTLEDATTIMANEATEGGGVYNAGTGTFGCDGTVAFNTASIGAGISNHSEMVAGVLCEGDVNVGATGCIMENAFDAASPIPGRGSGVFQDGKLYVDSLYSIDSTQGSVQDIYLVGGHEVDTGVMCGDRVIETGSLDADLTPRVQVEIENPYAGRAVVRYNVAHGVDAQHGIYILGDTVPDTFFLVERAIDDTVLELQNWQVFDVSIPQEYFIVFKAKADDSNYCEPKAIPQAGVNTPQVEADAAADVNLVEPTFKMTNNGQSSVKVELIGFVNDNASAQVDTGAYPDMRLVNEPYDVMGATTMDTDVYLGIRGTGDFGNFQPNPFGLLPLTSLCDYTQLGANALTLGTLGVGQSGEFSFAGLAGRGFMDHYGDENFPGGAPAQDKKDYLRQVNPGAPNTSVNARAKFSMYFRLTKAQGTA